MVQEQEFELNVKFFLSSESGKLSLEQFRFLSVPLDQGGDLCDLFHHSCRIKVLVIVSKLFVVLGGEVKHRCVSLESVATL